MPRSTATITAEQRRAIYELVCGHLVGLSDLCLALIRKDFATAQRLGLEFGEDLRLKRRPRRAISSPSPSALS